MRMIFAMPELVEDNCMGCKFCEAQCKYQAIQVIDNKAKIDESKCVGCLKCWDFCPHTAINLKPLPEPKVIKFDDSDVDPIAVKELCDRAHLDPERSMCMCTLTKAKEGAAAVIKGARTLEQLSAMTGLRTDCGVYCTAPMERLLEAYGVDLKFPMNAKGGYPITTCLRDVSKEVAEKYPEYFIEEEQKLDEKLELPTIVELF